MSVQEDDKLMSVTAELEQVTAELRGAERVALEAMRFLDEHGLLLEFRSRMEQVDGAASCEHELVPPGARGTYAAGRCVKCGQYPASSPETAAG